MIRKLKDSRGLSVVEMLCAVIMLSLLCIIMGAGLQISLKSYDTITAESETQVLLNDLFSAVNDELYNGNIIKIASASGDEYSYENISVSDNTSGTPGIMKLRDAVILPEGAYGNGRYKAAINILPAEASDVTPEEGKKVFNITLTVMDTTTDISSQAVLNDVQLAVI